MSSEEQNAKTFPVLWQSLTHAERYRMQQRGCPRTVPWSFVEPHRAQAKRNHDQTLERLAQRGGLSPAEIVALVTGRPLRRFMGGRDSDWVPELLALLAEHAIASEDDDIDDAIDASRRAEGKPELNAGRLELESLPVGVLVAAVRRLRRERDEARQAAVTEVFAVTEYAPNPSGPDSGDELVCVCSSLDGAKAYVAQRGPGRWLRMVVYRCRIDDTQVEPVAVLAEGGA